MTAAMRMMRMKRRSRSRVTAESGAIICPRVYGYHGEKNEDEGFIPRPRAWDAPHELTQLARYIARMGSWTNLLSDPDQMQSVLANAPRKWDAKNVQIVLECAVVRRESGMPRFLAAHFW